MLNFGSDLKHDNIRKLFINYQNCIYLLDMIQLELFEQSTYLGTLGELVFSYNFLIFFSVSFYFILCNPS